MGLHLPVRCPQSRACRRFAFSDGPPPFIESFCARLGNAPAALSVPHDAGKRGDVECSMEPVIFIIQKLDDACLVPPPRQQCLVLCTARPRFVCQLRASTLLYILLRNRGRRRPTTDVGTAPVRLRPNVFLVLILLVGFFQCFLVHFPTFTSYMPAIRATARSSPITYPIAAGEGGVSICTHSLIVGMSSVKTWLENRTLLVDRGCSAALRIRWHYSPAMEPEGLRFLKR